MRSLHASLADFKRIVKNCAKNRFQLVESEGQTFIRAVQGHSLKGISDDQLLEPLELISVANFPQVCVHGTYLRHFDSILSNGLVAGGLEKTALHRRNNIHFVLLF